MFVLIQSLYDKQINLTIISRQCELDAGKVFFSRRFSFRYLLNYFALFYFGYKYVKFCTKAILPKVLPCESVETSMERDGHRRTFVEH